MTADLSDADRQFYISLIKGFDLDQARNACNDIEAREGTKLLVDGMDLEGMRRALLVHHGDGDGGTAGGTGSGGGESGAVDGVEGDALLSAEDYLRIVDEMSPGEAKLACRQAGLKPKDDSPGAAKLSLRVHYIGKIDPMHARFCRYDKDGSGDIGQDEVAQIIKDVGFKVDGDYINGTMEVFGQYDADGDGSLGLEEFTALWNFLHIDVDDEHINLARLEFDKYDVDGDGVLGVEEVKKLMDDVGYNVDEHYVNGVMDVFAKFDDDKSGELVSRLILLSRVAKQRNMWCGSTWRSTAANL